MPVPAGAGGTSKHSLVVCSQVRTVDQTRIVGRLGTLPAPVMDAIGLGLQAILDL